MQYDYVVTLKRESGRKTDVISILLIFLSLFFFSYVQIRYGINYYLSFAILTVIVGLLVNLSAHRKGKEMNFRTWLFVAGLFWLSMPFLQWMILPYILFFFLEIQAKYPLEVGFNTYGIVLNTLFKKKIPWTDFQSVLLKDGLLTLDFRNNKIIQKEVPDDAQSKADEDEFNEYCRGKIVNLP